MSKKLSTVSAIAAVFILSGCVGPSMAHVAAERATFDWFAPMVRNYVTADQAIPDQDKITHLRGIDAWDDRIKADEALVGGVR